MIRTRCSCVIPASREEIYVLLTDRERMLALLPYRVEVLSEEELPGGMRASHMRAHLPSGAVLDIHGRGVERVEDERVVTRGTQAPAAFARGRRLPFGRCEMETTHTLEDHGDGTAVTLEVGWRFEPAALHAFVALFLRGRLLRKSEATLQRLRGPFLSWPTHEAPAS